MTDEALLHIQPGPTTTLAIVRTCPVCQREAHLVGATQDWYDTTWTCCRCGDSWAGGELLPRPFVRGWRQEAIRGACRRWWKLIAS